MGVSLPRRLLNVATNFRGFNQRMHNKTLIVDGATIAIVACGTFARVPGFRRFSGVDDRRDHHSAVHLLHLDY